MKLLVWQHGKSWIKCIFFVVILLLYALTINQFTFLHYIMCFIFDGSFFRFHFLAGVEIYLKINLSRHYYSRHFELLLFLHKRLSFSVSFMQQGGAEGNTLTKFLIFAPRRALEIFSSNFCGMPVMSSLMVKLSSYLALKCTIVILIAKFWISKDLILHWSSRTFKIRKNGHSVNLIAIIVLNDLIGNQG